MTKLISLTSDPECHNESDGVPLRVEITISFMCSDDLPESSSMTAYPCTNPHVIERDRCRVARAASA